ncbi:MAG: hypothetical protein HQL95_11725 [Magnetococcales bacterium]|nr:hypothetical protein [Magnetococcales bacterium]
MSDPQTPLPPPPGNHRRRDVITMIRFVRLLRRLALHPAAPPLPDAPATARFDPGHEAVMMGYDFHLSPQGPRLIEVNTNAGGALLAYIAQHPGFPTTPPFPEELFATPNRPRTRLLQTFFQEMALFTNDPQARPPLVVILDARPEEQFLYPEMVACAELLTRAGSPCRILDPEELQMGPDGVFHQGEKVAMIYNRHCDFYLETPAMHGLQAAWLNRQVCLTPNPRAYGLLADKRRLVAWSDSAALLAQGGTPAEAEFIRTIVPETRHLAHMDRERIWKERTRWVFKPCQGFGGRGVLIGDKISRARFDSLDPDDTLVQRHIPPSLTPIDAKGTTLKTDIRLFCYRDQLLGIGARAYRGQVTNLRTPGNGFLPVGVVN